LSVRVIVELGQRKHITLLLNVKCPCR